MLHQCDKDIIKSAEICGSRKTITQGSFTGCRFLESVKLPVGLEELGEGVFWQSKLAEVVFNDKLKIIGESAFELCEDLSGEIILPDGLMEIGKEAFKATGISSIEIPKTVKKVGEGAFANCENLRRIVVPDRDLKRQLKDEYRGKINIVC